MNKLDFSFEVPAWEGYLDTVTDSASAMTLLALMEGESEDAFEDMLSALEQRNILPDISDLPRPAVGGEAALRLRQEEQLVRKGLRPEDLEQNDPLRLYLEELAITPAQGNEQLLAQKSAAGDEKAQLALTNLGLRRVLDQACANVGRGVLLMDLIQEGNLGLWQAVSEYRQGDYAAFCENSIRFAMARAVLIQAREDGVGQKMRTALEDYRNVDEQLLSELGRNPTVEEIGEAMHISSEAAATVGKMVENARRLQLAKKEPEPEEEQEAQEQAVEDTAYFQVRQRVSEMLSGLTEREKKVISLRFGLEGGLPASAEEVGKQLKMTAQEVVAMETAAMSKMRRQ